jgi:4-amino-4-deoxy-L-arabinose transferase-like glycosyltransferase
LPFAVYISNLERKLIGGDTSWFALQIPRMSIMVPTGYPTFSLFAKLFTLLPIRDLAYRLNLFSAVFGALTTLVLFIAIHRLVKNKAISISAVFCVAFVKVFFYYAIRLEFDTLNAFFIALVLLSMIAYSQERSRKYLYFFFACLGLSLTNHPIALFMAPAFLFYVVIIHPKIFKSIKAVTVSILFLSCPF